MTKTELVLKLAQLTGQNRKDVDQLLETLGNVAQATLAEGGELPLPGIGKLSAKQHAERKGRNPKTGEEITIAARRAPHFSAAKALKDSMA